MKAALAVVEKRPALLLVFFLAFVACTTRQPQQEAAPARRDDFDKKLKCAGMLEGLRENASQNQFETEAFSRTFYSPRLNACLAEKYTLYPGNKQPETMELVNLSTNQTVWSTSVECKVRPTGNPDKPRMEYKCSDYFWNVQEQLESYVKANQLEEEGTQTTQ